MNFTPTRRLSDYPPLFISKTTEYVRTLLLIEFRKQEIEYPGVVFLHRCRTEVGGRLYRSHIRGYFYDDHDHLIYYFSVNGVNDALIFIHDLVTNEVSNLLTGEEVTRNDNLRAREVERQAYLAERKVINDRCISAYGAGPYDTAERRVWVFEQVVMSGKLTAKEAAGICSVTYPTIANDLKCICKSNNLPDWIHYTHVDKVREYIVNPLEVVMRRQKIRDEARAERKAAFEEYKRGQVFEVMAEEISRGLPTFGCRWVSKSAGIWDQDDERM